MRAGTLLGASALACLLTALACETNAPPLERDGGVDAASASDGGAGGAAGGVSGQGGGGAAGTPGSSERRALDVLFVVGTWSSMPATQESLGRSISALLQPLQNAGVAVRIGVSSADLGAMHSGIAASPNCRPGGDGGELRVATNCGLAAGARFLDAPTGGAGNFSGELSTVAGCLVRLGGAGCTYGQPLLAVVAASERGSFDGFFRSKADLLVVVVSDVDDCSAGADSPLFGDPSESVPQSRRLRCALRGHVCNGRSLLAAAQSWSLSQCAQETLPKDMLAIGPLVESVKRLKAAPARAFLAALVGSPADRATSRYVIRSGDGVLQLDPLCTSINGAAQPALRLESAVSAFGSEGRIVDLCAADLRPSLGSLADEVLAGLGASKK